MGMYIGAFSLFAVTLKYVFIVKGNQAKSFGEEKARTIVFVLHLVIPIIISGFNAVSNGNIDLVFWVDICWSHNQTIENIDSGIFENIGDFFCSNRQYQVATYFGENAANVLETILRATCGSLKILYLAFWSNLVEIILYTMLVKHVNR